MKNITLIILLSFIMLTRIVAQDNPKFLGTYSFDLWDKIKLKDRKVNKITKGIPRDSIFLNLFLEKSRLKFDFVYKEKVLITKYRGFYYEDKYMVLRVNNSFSNLVPILVWYWDSLHTKLHFESEELFLDYEHGGMVFFIAMPFGGTSYGEKDIKFKQLNKK